MEKKLKLSPLQLTSINRIIEQKQQLSKIIQDLNDKENLVVSLAFESINITDLSVLQDIKLDGEFVVYTEKESTSKQDEKKKKTNKPTAVATE